MNATREIISKTIRQAREAKGMWQSEVASALKVSVSAVSQWESGDSGLTDVNLLKIAHLLDIDLAKPGLVQPLDEALPEQETRQGEVWTAVDPSRVSELREQMEEIIDLHHAIDKVGDGIGGADGHAVSAVAFSAKTVADNVLHVLRVTEESRAPALGATPSRACACEVA